MSFFDLVSERAKKIDSLLCIGLDPERAALGPEDCNKAGLLAFCKRIVDPTSSITLMYKPNSAFFEQFVCVISLLGPFAVRAVRELRL
jgi:orotidine-5'-phosphate decarboxylase